MLPTQTFASLLTCVFYSYSAARSFSRPSDNHGSATGDRSRLVHHVCGTMRDSDGGCLQVGCRARHYRRHPGERTATLASHPRALDPRLIYWHIHMLSCSCFVQIRRTFGHLCVHMHHCSDSDLQLSTDSARPSDALPIVPIDLMLAAPVCTASDSVEVR